MKLVLSFGQRPGYLHFDVGPAPKLPSLEKRLAESIPHWPDVHRMLALDKLNRQRLLWVCK